MTNITRNIWRHADSGDRGPALREGESSWTYPELWSRASWVVETLKARGVSAGDRVLFVLPTSPEFVFFYYGALALGATVVPVNTLSTKPELEYFLEDTGCALAIGWDEAGEALGQAAESHDVPLWMVESGMAGTAESVPPVQVSGQDAAVIIYTSGTTGRPKGAVLTHENLLVATSMFARSLDLTPDDRIGTALPLFHVFGQIAVMAMTHSAGACLSILRPFSGVGMLQMGANHRLTLMAGVPTMWNEMLHAQTELTRDDFRSLRLACSGGAALPVEVSKAFGDRFGAVVVDGYGLSETTAAATFNAPGGERRQGSVGKVQPGLSIAILDGEGNEVDPGEVGEVAIDGPVVMREYWNRPEATAEARCGSWFLTGDYGRMDDDGYVWIVDRKKDLIIRGGYNVYPREVEEVLYTHPSVLEAAVVGVPDERLGEEIAAVVTPRIGETVDPEALRGWLGERVSDYKVPRIYHLVEALPKGATGKILKREIDRDTLRAVGVRPRRVER